MEEIQHRRQHTAGAAGRSRDYSTAGGILLRYCQRVCEQQSAPLHGAVVALGVLIIGIGLTAHVKSTGQHALMVQAAGDGVLHDLPALSQIVPDVRILILGHILPEIGIVLIAPAQDILHLAERIDILMRIPPAGLADIAAAYTEIGLLAQYFALRIVSLEIHTVGMLGQELLGLPDYLYARI